MSETIERVLFNSRNGKLGIGIRLRFIDKYHCEEIGNLEGYSIKLEPTEHDAWAIESEQGIWIVVANKAALEGIEDWGPL